MMQEKGRSMDETTFSDPPTLKPIYDELREEGEVKGRKKIALNMLHKGYTVKTSAVLTSLTEKEIIDEVRQEAKTEGIAEVALNVLQKGYTVEITAEFTNLPEEDVATLESKLYPADQGTDETI